MGWVFDESVVDRAAELAEQLVRGLAERLPPIRDFMALCRAIAAVEQEFERARLNLRDLHQRGIAGPADYASYEKIRKNLHTTQIRFVRLARALFANQPAMLRHIPLVRKPPAISQVVPGFLLPSSTGSGLGVAPAVAAAAIPAWMVGAIILALIAASILVVVGVIVTIIATATIGGLAAESLRDVALTRAQLEAHNEAQQARLAAFERCLEASSNRSSAETRSHCRLEAQGLVPTPPIVVADLPRPGAWIPWLVGGLAAVALAGGGLYIYTVWGRSSGSRALDGGLPIPYLAPKATTKRWRPMTPAQALHDEDRFSLDV